MERWMVFAMRYPRPVLVCIAVVTAAAALQLGQLQITITPQALVADGKPEQRLYEDTVATFGSDQTTVVYVRDPDLFNAEKLAAVRDAVAALEALPFVARTRSLFSVPEVRVRDELVTTAPYLEALPESAQQVERIRTSALKNPFVRRNLLSPDGATLAINIQLTDSAYNAGSDADAHIAATIDAAITPLRGRVAEAWQMGLPYLRSAIAQQAGQEQYRLLAVGFAALLLSLALLFRRRSALLIPLASAALSVVWLLGGMAFLGIPLNVLTAAVPVLLVIIGSTEDVHLLAEYYAAASGRGRSGAIRRMARRLGLAVGLTFLTSCLGFIAVSANPIGLVREFGLVAAAGLAVNFVLTVLLVPILLGMLGEQTARTHPGPGKDQTRPPTGGIARRLLTHRRLIIGAGLGALAGFAYLAGSLHIDNSIFRYLPTGSDAHQRAAAMQRDLAGIYTFQIVVDGHIDGTFEHVRYLEELHRIQRHIDRHSPFDHSLSFADYVAVLNSAVSDSGDPGLPEEDAVVETLMLFVDAAEVREFLSADASKASIVVRHGIAASQELRAAVRALAAHLDAEIDPDLEVTITGQSVLASEAANDLARGQVKSLLLILLAVFIVVSLLFMRAAAGLIAALIAGVPMVALFGIMGAAGIPLDSATSMIAAIAVGVGVDHTVHFMVRYRHHLGSGADSFAAIVRTVDDETRPIGAASLALALGFATLTLSDFAPVYWFGLLSAAMVVFGLLASLTLAPALLSYVRLLTVWDLLGNRLRRELGRHCPLFKGMRPLQVRSIVASGRLLRLDDGATLVTSGEHARAIRVLLRGSICMDAVASGGTFPGRLVHPPAGLLSPATPGHGMTDLNRVTAAGPTEVLVLDWRRLERLARRRPRTAFLLLRNLADCLGQRPAARPLTAAAPSAGTSQGTARHERADAGRPRIVGAS